MDSTYISRAFNYGKRRSWTPFIEDVSGAAERKVLKPTDALQLLDAYLAGKLASDTRTLTPPRMKRKMLHAIEDAIEAAYRVT